MSAPSLEGLALVVLEAAARPLTPAGWDAAVRACMGQISLSLFAALPPEARQEWADALLADARRRA